MPKRKMRVKDKGWTVLLVLALLVTPALAHAKMFGDWGLDMANDGAVIFVRNAGFVNEGSVAFICKKRPHGIGAIITPPKELYANAQETVKVVIMHGDNDSLVQEWRNGYRYIFQNDPDTVKELVTRLRTSAEAGVNENVGIMFSAAFGGEGATQDRPMLIQVRLKEFSQGYDEFERQCSKL
jgi:hypothetical protein